MWARFRPEAEKCFPLVVGPGYVNDRMLVPDGGDVELFVGGQQVRSQLRTHGLCQVAVLQRCFNGDLGILCNWVVIRTDVEKLHPFSIGSGYINDALLNPDQGNKP